MDSHSLYDQYVDHLSVHSIQEYTIECQAAPYTTGAIQYNFLETCRGPFFHLWCNLEGLKRDRVVLPSVWLNEISWVAWNRIIFFSFLERALGKTFSMQRIICLHYIKSGWHHHHAKWCYAIAYRESAVSV